MDFKKTQSTFLQIRSNKAFELFVISVIIFSALVIGVKTYNLPEYVHQIIDSLDLLITVIFLMEIIVRFIADEHKNRFFYQGWNIFDTSIVILSLIPIEDSEMAFLGRLIRVFRVLRMISIIPELRLLLNSLLKALPQLGYVLLLMFIIFYIYAAAGSMLFASINETLWADISISMLTLFRVMTFEDWTDIMYETMEIYPFSWLYYLSFIFFTAFAFLNMVIGIVVNMLEKESRLMEQQTQATPDIEHLQADIKHLINQLSQLQQQVKTHQPDVKNIDGS